VPDAMPARWTGTDPVSECDAGVPAKPTPVPMSMYATPICQWWLSSFQSRSIQPKASRRDT